MKEGLRIMPETDSFEMVHFLWGRDFRRRRRRTKGCVSAIFCRVELGLAAQYVLPPPPPPIGEGGGRAHLLLQLLLAKEDEQKMRPMLAGPIGSHVLQNSMLLSWLWWFRRLPTLRQSNQTKHWDSVMASHLSILLYVFFLVFIVWSMTTLVVCASN